MTPRALTVLTGDCRELLKTLPAESVDCCVSSPPYWGLRDYGHRNQIGQETTPEQYVGALRAVFAEVRRVLKNHGTLWLNLGDSYASARPCPRRNSIGNDSSAGGRRGAGPPRLGSVLKEKDLAGIPWMVAFALRVDGWHLRSDIIWHKPNPIPESVSDRPTKAHEYLFLLSKSPRYFYDGEAIKEPAVCGQRGSAFLYKRARELPLKARDPGERGRFGGKSGPVGGHETRTIQGRRNKRTVWTVPTHPYRGAHFATYPPDLIRPCILAGTSANGCCSGCGAPWERLTEKGAELTEWKKSCGAGLSGGYGGRSSKDFHAAKAQDASAVKARILAGMREMRTVGWRPACDCKRRKASPCVVLDPFAGSGTTGKVALELGRRAILIELNPAYRRLIRSRCDVAH